MIKLDTFITYIEPETQLRICVWKSKGVIVKEEVLTAAEYLTGNSIICRHCLRWRADKVFMDREANKFTVIDFDKKHTYTKCPECDGLDIQGVICDCGLKPHSITCKVAVVNF